MLFDSHAHIDDRKLFADLENILERAEQSQVKQVLNCGADWPSSLMSVRLAEKYPGRIYAAVGVHPHDAKDLNEEILAKLSDLAQEKTVVAWGEIGLDYYHNHSPKEAQQLAFRQQIAAAKQLKKPIIIHDRDAHQDILNIIKEEDGGANGGIFHCFSGSWEMAKECMKLGFLISFAGPVTFNNAVKLQEVAKKVPADMMLIETDCPYLTPHPFRGKLNEPAKVIHVAEKLAELRQVSYQEICEITRNNACRIFGIEQ